MWKYQCKRHLIAVLIGMAVGLFVFHDISKTMIVDVIAQLGEQGITDAEMIATMKSDTMIYVMSMLCGGGMVNTFLLIYYLMQRFNPLVLFLAMIFINPVVDIAMAIGVIGLIPAIFVCIYGILTTPNRGKHKQFEKNQVTSVTEIERVYRLHHTYLDEYEGLAKRLFITNISITCLYALGVLTLILSFNINNYAISMMVLIVYIIILFYVIKKKNENVQPIISLLYEQCNPEACASAIFALSKKMHAKKNFPLGQYLAQCMIYLNDPHLAIDVLACTKRNNVNLTMAYHSIMAYANYQLGDESEVRRHYDECEKLNVRGVNSPLAMIKQQYLQSIENKLNLMDKEFDKARTFYQQALNTTTMEFQKVDFHYYLGLIAFVEEDIWEAKTQFEYVTQHGNGMYFIEKARKFLIMIDQIRTQED